MKNLDVRNHSDLPTHKLSESRRHNTDVHGTVSGMHENDCVDAVIHV